MIDLIKELFEFILHIDKHLSEIVRDYNTLTYLILFAIVFCETGLVVTPLLPGDSLLFAAGSIAALDGSPLNVYVLAVVLFAAAFGGDNTNYFIGNYIGPKVFHNNYRFLKKEYLLRTQEFYQKHGGKAVIIARFVPIIRTFAPFVAGVGSMRYARFIGFSMLGTALWILIFVTAGYQFGQMEIIRKNFSLVTIGIVLISVIPIAVGFVKSKLSRSNQG